MQHTRFIIKLPNLLCFMFFISIMLLGCKDNLEPVEYARWVENENNGLQISKTQGDYIFSLQYKPVEYIVAMQQRKPQIQSKLLKQEKEKMEGLQYYNFKIAKQSGGAVLSENTVDIPDKEIYLLSGMKKDLFLLEGTDTLYCKVFHFENSNGLTPYDNCVVAFEKNKNTATDKTFLYRGNKLGIDWVKLDVKAEAINRVPNLKTI